MAEWHDDPEGHEGSNDSAAHKKIYNAVLVALVLDIAASSAPLLRKLASPDLPPLLLAKLAAPSQTFARRPLRAAPLTCCLW